MGDVDQLVALGKIVETVGTIGILLIALYIMVKGDVISRSTIRDLLNNRDKHLEAQLSDLRKDVAALTEEVKELRTPLVRCRLIQEWLEARRKTGGASKTP